MILLGIVGLPTSFGDGCGHHGLCDPTLESECIPALTHMPSTIVISVSWA